MHVTVSSDNDVGRVSLLVGSTGPQGTVGVQGLQGIQGVQGTTGSQGAQGFNGTTGSQGTQGEIGAQGIQASQGTLGIQGPIGETGTQGIQGEIGTQGFSGAQGTLGLQGSVGDTGVQGVQGAEGTQGTDGTQGATGTGLQGPAGTTQGAQGLVGTQGSDGVQGSTGTGSQGTTGSQGATGSTGVQGTDGTQGGTGAQGITGSQGTTGTQGTNGTQGTVGNQGTTGDTGSQGTTGIQGVTGIKGDQGEFGGATFEYVYLTNTANTDPNAGNLKFDDAAFANVTRLFIDFTDSNSANVFNYMQTIDDSTSSVKGVFKLANSANVNEFAYFNINGLHSHVADYFSIPVAYLSGASSLANSTNVIITFTRTGDKGDTGNQGITGSQGTTGTQGTLGTQGTIGVQGNTGTQGTNGTQGTTGAQGITGSQGTTGTQGTDGTQGTTGNQGITGSQGVTGSQGLDGTQGTNGAQGTTGAQGQTGAQGETGIQGAQGVLGGQGITGAQGTTGIQGVQGGDGTQGIQGVTGGQGITGAQGTLGSQGTIGTQGPTGITASGTANNVAKFTGTSTFGNSVIYDDGTNVGIGTTSPNIGGYGVNSRILTIQGVSGSYAINELASNSANADGVYVGRIDFSSRGQAAGYENIASIASFLSGSTSTKFGSVLQFFTRSDNAASGALVERMRLAANGNVGIGTTSPTATLHAYNGTAGQEVSRFEGNYAGSGSVTLANFMRVGGAVAAGIIYDDSASPLGISFGTTTNHQLNFRTNNTERMRLDVNGVLLRGSTTARNTNALGAGQAQFEAAGFAAVQVFANPNTSDGSYIGLWKSRGGAVGGTTIVQNGDTFGEIFFGGYDGSTAIPGASISAFCDGTPGSNDMPGRITFSTTADGAGSVTERMRIDSSGNVGIGTSSPSYKLVVSKSGVEGFEFVPGFTTGLSLFQTYNRTTSGYDSLRVDSADYRFTIGGSEKVRIDTSGNVGIGTTSPGTTLDTRGANKTVSSQYGIASIYSTDAFAIDKGGSLSFGGKYATDGSSQTFASIAGRKESSSDGSWSGYLQFSTGTTLAERMRIDSAGNVGIGTTSPVATLHVANTGTIIDTPVTTITANATYAENAAGKVVVVNSASNLTVTAAAASVAGFSYTVIRKGAGTVTIANTSGVTRLNSASYTALTITRNAAATIVYTATNEIFVFGDFS